MWGVKFRKHERKLMGHDRGKQTPESFACKIKTELSVETLFLPDEQKK